VKNKTKVQIFELRGPVRRRWAVLAVGLVGCAILGAPACAEDAWPTGRTPNDPSSPKAAEAPLGVAERTEAPGASASSPPASADAGVAYVCPMHPEVRSNTPVRCPKCGMDLVPRTP
jgi:hypothetical protein